MGRKKKTFDTFVLYPYETFYKLLCAKSGNASIADKRVGDLIGESERQVRNAKFDGMNAYTADKFCIKGLGMCPVEVFGLSEWASPEALFAAELADKNVTREEVEQHMQEIGWQPPKVRESVGSTGKDRILTEAENAGLDAVVIVDESEDLLLS